MTHLSQPPNPQPTRRNIFKCLAASSLATLWPSTRASTGAAWEALRAPGAIVLFRHALAPGGGDPAGFKVGDCSSQRNLSDEGRAQAKRIGQTLQERSIRVQAVWHSAWCRTRDTAQLAFPELAAPLLRPEPAFNSFFNDRDSEPAQTAAARQMLLAWRGPGVLLVVTHQVNITALTGIVPQSGEGVVVMREAGKLVVKGQILP